MRRLAVVASGLLVTTWAATSTAQIAPPTPAPAAPPAASAPALPAAPPPAPSPEVDAEKKNQARAAFESGIAHFDRGEWSAALADFLRSRELFPTKSATKNAGVCFRREGRLDEELESFETLLREFADLAPADRAFAEKEIADLRALVGNIEIGAAWKKVAKETGREYHSLKLDDPSFPAPIYASLVENEDGYALIWSR